MVAHSLQPFQWGNINFSQIVYIGGIPHATKTAIGEWLEYSDPRTAINKIIERNPYLRHYSVGVKLTSTDSKNYDTDVYHPIGFLLIVMESAQTKAQAMKLAVAEFVWQFVGPYDVGVKERNAYIREIERLTERLTVTQDAMLYQLRLQSLQYFCRLAAWPMPDLALLGKDTEQLCLEV